MPRVGPVWSSHAMPEEHPLNCLKWCGNSLGVTWQDKNRWPYEADPTKNGLRLSRFPAPLVTPAFGFLCFYGIYYMKGRHRRARFVRIAHYTRLRIFTDANNTHRTHTNTRIFSSFLRSNRPQRPSQRARLGWVRPRAVHHRAPSCRLPDLCLADGRVSM